ncbi:hypothetical protein SS1G_08982 [Sclerotinia sclerotiorum 1980 UF-70]|uniref:Major facilitator superfamily (MFS) profile domain-containing protein n=1 Tax=Sclerotinia sclerotiorum (strain ATCC 18683 / 1980 / Ss-1) TaxID=665079 RepID=A7EUH5_SCLS1|nr:hypothetical protein SS1G_08982 [Sclerotinia sclerotiorum 1980 UF-70]EDN93117.1 hypothetical protein SS1G_08982 [Sclerotinia sclerotiorum 1980 UF-70]
MAVGLGQRFLMKIVRNESMRTPEIYGWRVFFLASSACFGGMLFGWDIGTIGGVIVMPSFTKYFSSDVIPDAELTSSNRAYHIDHLSDTARANLLSNRVVIQCATHGYISALYVGRLIAGLGVGAASMLTPLYVSENAPRAIRGALTGMYQLFIATGTMLSFWINYGSLLHLKGDAPWIGNLTPAPSRYWSL